ncbi:MAG TPA: ATP-binding protein [Verrucomicrobium sp.]|nr:ATP-binding protein [Verrucomicrobium sp.]
MISPVDQTLSEWKDDGSLGQNASFRPELAVETRILVLAPSRNDARLTASFLHKADLQAEISQDRFELCRQIGKGAGAVLVAEETLDDECVKMLAAELHAQPSWSDLPLLIVTGTGEATRNRQRYLAILGPVANIAIVERPVRPATLVASCHVALRSRRRQYQVRDLLEDRQEVVESISDAFLTFDPNWRCTFLNEKAASLTGRTPDEVLGKPLWDLFPEAWFQPLQQKLAGGPQDASNLDFEQYHARTKRWLDVRVFPTTKGVSIFINDVTERRQARQQLRESKARLQFALESAQIGDWDLNLTDGTVYHSLRHDQAFGYSEPIPDWTFDTFIEHIHPDDREAVVSRYESAIAGNEPWRFECRVTWPDESLHWIAVHGSLYHDGEGRASRMIGIIMDITARKDAEQAQLHQTQALRDADQKKDEFLAMLSHELRNPLASVANAATLILSGADPESYTWAAGVIERQTRQLAHLIDDLLDVSRISTGKIHLRKAVVDAALILDRACETARPLVQERGHNLVCRYPAGALWLEADATRIEQVVLNLLTNAAKYTPNGGRIELCASEQDGELVIRVRDNGTGIVPERVPEMFQLFAQGERSIARSEGGLGIGLTIVQKIVEMHGGRVIAESDGPNKGSTFSVYLPSTNKRVAKLASLPQVDSAAKPSPGNSPKCLRVLIVDDNTHSAQGLARLLARAGHDTVVAYDGPQALEQAAAISPEAVVLDIGLPGMDGYEVAKRLRERQSIHGTERAPLIIAVTGYGHDDDRQRSQDAGFDHHLVKPVDFAELKQLLSVEAAQRP